MRYTNSKEADNFIEKDVEIIKKIVLEKFNIFEIKAIVMFGGFGHGGGSYKKLKNKIIPLNDYDLYIISEKGIPGEILEKVGMDCSKALGKGGLEIVENYGKKWDENEFFHVDLHNISYKNLAKSYPTQRSFDLKTSLIIYGDKNILDKIPEIKISKSDAIRMLFNKIDHFALAENNSKMLKNIYAIKGFNDSCSALLIFYGGYTSRYQDRVNVLKEIGEIHKIPKEYIKLVEKATNAKLNKGYYIENTEEFFKQSKKWVEWVLKKIIKTHLEIDENEEDWKKICRIMYRDLPYIYFNDYLRSKWLFFGQYYLNIRFFLEGLRKKEFLPKSLFRWRDAGLIIAIALILESFEENEEAKKYLKKLTGKTEPLKERIMKLYSVYYLQKLI